MLTKGVNMSHSHRRHDITDKAWALLEPHLPGREGSWGGIAKDNRQVYQRRILDHAHRRAVA